MLFYFTFSSEIRPRKSKVVLKNKSDVKSEDQWQVIDLPLIRLLALKNVLRFVLNRADAEYDGTSLEVSSVLIAATVRVLMS